MLASCSETEAYTVFVPCRHGDMYGTSDLKFHRHQYSLIVSAHDLWRVWVCLETVSATVSRQTAEEFGQLLMVMAVSMLRVPYHSLSILFIVMLLFFLRNEYVSSRSLSCGRLCLTVVYVALQYVYLWCDLAMIRYSRKQHDFRSQLCALCFHCHSRAHFHARQYLTNHRSRIDLNRHSVTYNNSQYQRFVSTISIANHLPIVYKNEQLLFTEKRSYSQI